MHVVIIIIINEVGWLWKEPLVSTRHFIQYALIIFWRKHDWQEKNIKFYRNLAKGHHSKSRGHQGNCCGCWGLIRGLTNIIIARWHDIPESWYRASCGSPIFWWFYLRPRPGGDHLNTPPCWLLQICACWTPGKKRHDKFMLLHRPIAYDVTL